MKLFKNANLVDIKNNKTNLVDILVDGGIIVEIAKGILFDGEIVDLGKNYVIPAFVNAYSNSNLAIKNSYGVDVCTNELEVLAQQLVLTKNVLAGATMLNDKPCLVDEISERSEDELESISESVAKTKQKLFIKVGQSLEELGLIDKHYGKNCVEVLEDFGFLDRNCEIIGANCLEKDELELIKNYDKKIVLTPYEDARLGRRPTNIVSLQFLGIETQFGSGDFAEIDFFAFMRQILLTQRGMFENPQILDEKDVFEIACGKDTIKVGESADFAVVGKSVSLGNNVLKELVWGKSKTDVVMTVFKGEILQKNGKIFMKNIPDCDTIKEMIIHQRRN